MRAHGVSVMKLASFAARSVPEAWIEHPCPDWKFILSLLAHVKINFRQRVSLVSHCSGDDKRKKKEIGTDGWDENFRFRIHHTSRLLRLHEFLRGACARVSRARGTFFVKRFVG